MNIKKNKRRSWLIRKELVATSGKRNGEGRQRRYEEVGGTNYWVSDRLKDVLYNMGDISNINNSCKWTIASKFFYNFLILKIVPNKSYYGLPWCSNSKESACNSGHLGSIPGLGRSPGREWLSTPGFLPGEFHDQRSLVGFSSFGHKELDMTWTTNAQIIIKQPVLQRLFSSPF